MRSFLANKRVLQNTITYTTITTEGSTPISDQITYFSGNFDLILFYCEKPLVVQVLDAQNKVIDEIENAFMYAPPSRKGNTAKTHYLGIKTTGQANIEFDLYTDIKYDEENSAENLHEEYHINFISNERYEGRIKHKVTTSKKWHTKDVYECGVLLHNRHAYKNVGYTPSSKDYKHKVEDATHYASYHHLIFSPELDLPAFPENYEDTRNNIEHRFNFRATEDKKATLLKKSFEIKHGVLYSKDVDYSKKSPEVRIISEDFEELHQSEDIKMFKDEPFYFSTNGVNFFIFDAEQKYDIASFDKIDDEYSLNQTANSPWGFSIDKGENAFFKISTKIDQYIKIYLISLSTGFDEHTTENNKDGSKKESVHNCLFVSKPTFDAKVGFDYSIKNKLKYYETNSVIYYNPNGFVTNETQNNKVIMNNVGLAYISITEKDYNDNFLDAGGKEKDNALKKATGIKYTGNEGSIPLLDQEFSIKRGIFYKKGIDYSEFFANVAKFGSKSSKLPDYAITIIVVIALAVVGCIGFGVYWYGFKQGLNDDDYEEEEQKL